MNEIRFTVPLPPPALRANSRAHWGTKVAAKQTYSLAVWGWWLVAHDLTPKDYQADLPWEAADVHYEWHYCGNAPDAGNLGPNVKALQDILCVAPNNGLQKNNTTYLGLVENDKNITPTYSMVQEKRRAAEHVNVTVTNRSADAVSAERTIRPIGGGRNAHLPQCSMVKTIRDRRLRKDATRTRP